MPVALKQIIPAIFKNPVDWRLTLLNNWTTIVGGLQTRIRLEKIYEDTIVIGVYESHWMQELYLLSSLLIDKINEHLKEKRINHLRFKLVEEKKRILFAQSSQKKLIIKEVQLTDLQKNALIEIKDEQLSSALITFWQRCQSLEEK